LDRQQEPPEAERHPEDRQVAPVRHQHHLETESRFMAGPRRQRRGSSFDVRLRAQRFAALLTELS
jgi:hypothetical protein